MTRLPLGHASKADRLSPSSEVDGPEPADRQDDALALLEHRGVPAWVLGRVEERAERTVELAASYAGRAATWR